MSTAAPISAVSANVNHAIDAAEQLPDDVATLKRMILELLAAIHVHRQDNEELRARLDRLLRRLYGPKSERFAPNQPLLFGDLTAIDPAAATPPGDELTTSGKKRARPHGRQQLPDNLPCEPKHHTLSEAERVCPDCGQERIDIGAESSKQVDYRPASVVVIEHLYHKYLCPECSSRALVSDSAATTPATRVLTPQPTTNSPVPTPTTDPVTITTLVDPSTIALTPPAPLLVSAPRPPALLPRCLAGPGLLAYIAVSKYADHLPLYRLEHILARHGLHLTRQTMCGWMAACAQALTPLYEVVVARLLGSRVLHTDDTPVTIQNPEPGATATGRMWAYIGDAAHPYNVFDFTPNRKRDGPQQFLEDFSGYLQADAFTGYDALYLPDPSAGQRRIIEVACNAHARRKFYDARTSDELRSSRALAYYGQLYELERRTKDFDEMARRQLRQDLAVPIVTNFKAWLDQEKLQVLPKSPMGEAIGYALNNWTALVRYTEAGFLAIDNNVAEREMKKIAIGRKNWLFVGTANGGRTAAVLITFTSTCQRLGIDPWAYLHDLFTRLPTTPVAQLADWLPDNWQTARQAAATPVSAPA